MAKCKGLKQKFTWRAAAAVAFSRRNAAAASWPFSFRATLQPQTEPLSIGCVTGERCSAVAASICSSRLHGWHAHVEHTMVGGGSAS